ncbi:hypothetical protein BH758_12495 [Enterococcus hirae]|uniref:DUF7736 domain-containing protein n=1 Tax=Enterococcus hirae TaxID=1354 RepID=UPI0009C0ED0F|nr:hypothetical protein [Enterococcus hirae]EMF0137084.1 hypothetical protein [Enterococcus hirae]OQO40235.1 hypothetical protein BH758_12495 [Enterococcus hirae]
MKRLTERQAFVVTCWSGVLFMDYGGFWQIAEECLGNTIINDEFANPELWEKLKEKTKDDFNDLVFHQKKVK